LNNYIDIELGEDSPVDVLRIDIEHLLLLLAHCIPYLKDAFVLIAPVVSDEVLEHFIESEHLFIQLLELESLLLQLLVPNKVSIVVEDLSGEHIVQVYSCLLVK
jgi:hypothetical protein